MVSLLRDIGAVLGAALVVERDRRRVGPAPLLRRLRERGRQGPVRSARERSRLLKLIRIVDACFPGGGNCYRRALLATAVDPVIAETPLTLGLRSGGGARSGHAWLGPYETPTVRYDAELSV